MKETTPSSKRIILGVDPGTTVMGYGLIAVNGKQMTLLHMDELVMNSKENHYLRLQKIFEKTIAIIDRARQREGRRKLHSAFRRPQTKRRLLCHEDYRGTSRRECSLSRFR